MRERYLRVKAFGLKYRGEIIISAVSTVGGVVFSNLIDASIPSTRIDLIQTALLFTIAVLIIAVAFRMKRDVTSRIRYLQDTVARISGQNPPTPYDERKAHFPEEKNRLIEELARYELPNQVASILKARGDDATPVALVIDSGTTLEPLFPRLKFLGLGTSVPETVAKKLQVYTNSLSGSDAFSKEPASALAEHQLHLFGGIQIEKYRAVVGDVTIRAMDAVKQQTVDHGGKIIGLITANWFLVGHAYQDLIICSSERGHLDYKRRVAAIADVLIIVTPLGKLLKLETVDELNEILGRKSQNLPEYESFALNRDRETTFLMTTKRTNRASILYPHSESLWSERAQKMRSYKLVAPTRSLKFDPHGPQSTQLDIEVPHEYLRVHKLHVLQIHS